MEKEAAHVGNGRADYTLTDKIVDGKLKVQQGVIAGCAGGNYTNVVEAANVLRGKNCGNGEFSLAVYPSSQPVFINLARKGITADLMELEQSSVQLSVDRALVQAIRRAITDSVSVIRPEISRTEKDPNQETDRCQPLRLWMPVPSQQQRQTRDSLHQQKNLTGWGEIPEYTFDDTVYRNRIYYGFQKGDEKKDLVYGPNIKDWPEMSALTDNILLKYAQKLWILSQQQMN